MNDSNPNQIIDGLAEFFAKSMRTPILKRPDEYGMAYEDVFFPSLDGVSLEGWFIPADSDRLVICNHFMPGNRYGYPGHLEPWTGFGGFEVNFLPGTRRCTMQATTSLPTICATMAAAVRAMVA